MTEYCCMCHQYVEIVNNGRVWGISELSSDTFEFVCDRCVNKKLNFGEPRKGGCLFGNHEIDYELRHYEPSLHTNGYSYFAKQDRRPIICENHFQELVEEEGESVISIDDALSGENELQPPEISIPDAIGREEDQHIEYKENFQYNPYTDGADKSLKPNLVDEVVALGNSDGGVVIIGVRDDDMEATGLQRDYDSIDGDWDELALQIGNVISSHVGEAFAASYTEIAPHKYDDGTDIGVIYVDPSPSPLFNNDDDFYVRDGSSSRPLVGSELAEYISNHWET